MKCVSDYRHGDNKNPRSPYYESKRERCAFCDYELEETDKTVVEGKHTFHMDCFERIGGLQGELR